MATMVTHRPLPLDQSDVRYEHGPDSFAQPGVPAGETVELTWRDSEFALLRLQLSRDRPNADYSDNAITVQYQTALGAHGAHKF